jgi:hypothetical protein
MRWATAGTLCPTGTVSLSRLPLENTTHTHAAQHTTLGSANGGLDMTMPGTDFSNQNVFWGPQLQSAIGNGQVQQSRLDDMVRRVLAAWYLTGQGT